MPDEPNDTTTPVPGQRDAETSWVDHRTPDEILKVQKEQFKSAYIETKGMVRTACNLVHSRLHPRTVEGWRREDKAFAAWWEEQEDLLTEDFVAELHLRAKTGRMSSGEVTNKRSDDLLRYVIERRRGSLYERKAQPPAEPDLKVSRQDHTLPAHVEDDDDHQPS